MGVPRQYWNEAYREGAFLSRWDYEFPSQELIGALSVLAFPKGSSALDLGCGGGRDAIFLAQNGFNATGIDFSPAAIEVASLRSREAGTSVTWLVGDVLKLPFEKPEFELVTDRACFHHIPDEDRAVYAREVARVLKPGGTLILRGSALRRDDSFFEVTAESIRAIFGESDFSIGPALPIKLANNAGGLTANMAILRRKS